MSLGTAGGLASHTTGSVQFTAITGAGPGLEFFGLDPNNLLNQPLDMSLTDITATIGTQTANVVNWGMKYNPLKGGQMDGSITMGVQGDFMYFVKYAYPHRKEPDMFISCTQPM